MTHPTHDEEALPPNGILCDCMHPSPLEIGLVARY